jgi:hypothetical protein
LKANKKLWSLTPNKSNIEDWNWEKQTKFMRVIYNPTKNKIEKKNMNHNSQNNIILKVEIEKNQNKKF